MNNMITIRIIIATLLVLVQSLFVYLIQMAKISDSVFIGSVLIIGIVGYLIGRILFS